MHVALVGPEIEENLSLRYLASSLRASGHRPHIVPFSERDQIPKVARTLLRRPFDLIGLSLVFQRRAPEYYELVETLRRRGYGGHITAGGHFASLRAPEILRDAPGIDTILHHEGETRIVRLAGLLERKRSLPGDLDGVTWRGASGNLRHRRPTVLAPLDDLPPPMRKKPGRQIGIPVAPIVSSRGCAGDCSFCSIRAWHRQVRGARLRLRSPDAVAEEMASLNRDHGVRIFIFHDDDFILPARKKAFDRCRSILDAAGEKIPEPFSFVIKCRPDDVDEDLFAYLQSRGLDRVFVGIESQSESGLRTLNRRVGRAQNERALEILERLGIYSCFNLLLFDPDTTVDSLEENLRFLKKQIARPFDVGRTELYAGAALERRMIEEGRVVGDYRGWDYRIAEPQVEAVFRLFVELLWERHFGSLAIAQEVQDLGYRFRLLRRFHPYAATSDLAERIDRFVRAVGSETVERIETFHRFVSEHPVRSAPMTDRFIEQQKTELSRSSREHARRLRLLSYEIEARARLARFGLLSRPTRRPWVRFAERLATSMPLAALALQISSCGNGGGTILDPPPPPHVFSTDLEPRFAEGCAKTGCHDTATASAGLVLESGRSYDQLVGLSSSQLPMMMRVEPFQPDSSYLFHKLSGSQLEVGGMGGRMPLDGDPDWDLTSGVELWIERGAKED